MNEVFKSIEEIKIATSRCYDVIREHITDLEKQENTLENIIDDLNTTKRNLEEINSAINGCIKTLSWFEIYPGDQTINETGMEQIKKAIEILQEIRYSKKEKKDIPPELLGKEKGKKKK